MFRYQIKISYFKNHCQAKFIDFPDLVVSAHSREDCLDKAKEALGDKIRSLKKFKWWYIPEQCKTVDAPSEFISPPWDVLIPMMIRDIVKEES